MSLDVDVTHVALGLLSACTTFIYVLWLPGYLVGRLFAPELRSVERMAITQVCSFTVVPLSYFLVAVAAGIPLDPSLLWVLSTVVIAGAGALIHQRAKEHRCPRLGELGISPNDVIQHLVLALACSVLVLLFLRALDGGDVFSTLQHCLYVIVMHTISNDPSTAVPLYDHLSGDTVHVLVNHTRDAFNGLAPLFHEQRLGNAAIMAPHVSLLGSAGWYTVVIHASMMTGLCCYVGARQLEVGRGSAGIASGLLLLATHNLCAYTVNENMFAVAIVSFLLWFALRTDLNTSHALLIGLVLGHLVGVRHTSSLFWPGAILALVWSPKGLKRAMVAVGAALLTASPWLYVNYLMLGNPLSHPKVINDSDGRVVLNSWLGFSFYFKALNYPFTQSVVRTAWHPFPTFIWLPLMMAWSFGQIAFSTALYGIREAMSRRRALVLIACFAIPHNLAMAWLELLDWEQLSYAAPGFVPLGLLLALGIHRLHTGQGRHRIAFAGILITVIFASYGLRVLEVPVDTRGLDASHWATPPAPDRGVVALRDELTRFRPLPRVPVARSVVLKQFVGSLEHSTPPQTGDGSVPVYRSGQVGLLTGYAETAPRTYEFGLEGREQRTEESTLRTGVSLHTVTLHLKAARLQVRVERHQGRYDVYLEQTETAETEQDFTFWINPWRPYAKAINVYLDNAPLDGLKVHTYGGMEADGEGLLLATNYPSTHIAIEERRLRIDDAGETTHCGWILFGHEHHDMTRIETLVLAGGHVLFWHGEKDITLRLPRNILADQLILFSEPYCSSHVPQYGDRYGSTALAPDGTALEVRLDKLWMP